MIDERDKLQSKDFVDEEGEGRRRKRRSRKTIGEEGSRKQTALGLMLTIVLGLAFYLPVEIKKWWQDFNRMETITIEKPVGDSEDVSKVIGFEVVIKEKQDVKDAIEELLKDLPGSYGVWVSSLSSNEGFVIRGNELFETASINKLPMLVKYYQEVDSGKIDPEEIYLLQEKDRWEYGTGSMQNQPAGTKYSYQEIAELTANISDNMGAQFLSRLVKTKLIDEMILSEAGEIFVKLFRGELMSQESTEKLLASLTDTVNEDRITAGVPSGVRVAHKFGSEVGVVNDCGVVFAKEPYVICVMTKGINEGQAQEVLPKISRVVWEWLGAN